MNLSITILVVTTNLMISCAKPSITGSAYRREAISNDQISKLPGHPNGPIKKYKSTTYNDGTTSHGIAKPGAILVTIDGEQKVSCPIPSGDLLEIYGTGSTSTGESVYHTGISNPCSASENPKVELSEGYIKQDLVQIIDQENDLNNTINSGLGKCHDLDIISKDYIELQNNPQFGKYLHPLVKKCSFNPVPQDYAAACQKFNSFGRTRSIPGAFWGKQKVAFLLKATGSEVTFKMIQTRLKSSVTTQCPVFGGAGLVSTHQNLSLTLNQSNTFTTASTPCTNYADKKISLTGLPKNQDGYFTISAETVYSPNNSQFDDIEVTAIVDNDPKNSCRLLVDLMSPIVFDFSRDQFLSTLQLANSHAYFDLKAKGAAVRTGWIAGDNRAFLAIDRNRNGKIDDGSELFGEATSGSFFTNGYEALIYEAKTHLINASTPIYSKLVLWFDYNGNGQTEAGELRTLDEMNITRISLEYKPTGHKPSFLENDVRYKAKFWGPKQCGKQGCNSYDVFFSTIDKTVSTR